MSGLSGPMSESREMLREVTESAGRLRKMEVTEPGSTTPTKVGADTVGDMLEASAAAAKRSMS